MNYTQNFSQWSNAMGSCDTSWTRYAGMLTFYWEVGRKRDLKTATITKCDFLRRFV